MTAAAFCKRIAAIDAFCHSRAERCLSNRIGLSIRLFVASIALALSGPNSAEAGPPRAFIPTGKWILTGDEGQCFLTHMYTDGGNLSSIRIDQFPRQYGFRTTVTFGYHYGGHVVVPARIGFDGTRTRRVERTEIFNEVNSDRRVYRTFLGPDDFDHAAKSGSLIVMPFGYIGLQLLVPQLADAIIALRRCEQLLIETSGLPPQDMRRLKSFPEPLAPVGNTPYRQTVLEKNADPEDVAVSRGMIDKQGMPYNCEVIHPAKSATLNVEACDRIMNAKFDPATDLEGNPVPAPFFVETMWPMPS